MTIGQITKRVLRYAGIQAYSWENLPWGISLERDIQRFLTNRLPPFIFFDVGANAGQTALRFRQASNKAMIHCFEPIIETYQMLVKTIGTDPLIIPHRLALGDKNQEVIMEISQNSQWNRIIKNGTIPRERTQCVPMKRLDTFCKDHGISSIDLLKTDCEGFDLEVLVGAGSMLLNGGIAAVLCEVNLRKDGRHSDFFAMHDFLSKKGFYSFASYDHSGWGILHSEGSFQNTLWLRTPTGRHPAV